MGAGVETKASSAAAWASGMDVSILSTAETLGAAVVGFGSSNGSGT
jgi:hypothetical protein